MRERDKPKDVPAILFWLLPLLIVFVPILAYRLRPDPAFTHRWIDSEFGLIENAALLLSLLGLFHAVRSIRSARALSNRFLIVWMTLFALGFFYIAGEEASWGQHWLGLETPGWLAERNLQEEINLHNLTRQGDKVPKTIIGLCVVLGGIVWPMLRSRSRARTGDPDDWRVWLLPTHVVIPTAVCFLGLWILSRVIGTLDPHQVAGSGPVGQEHRELLMTVFLYLYTFSIDRRAADLRPR